MEQIEIRTQSLLTRMVAHPYGTDLSANETKGACVLPSRPRPACRSNRPDTYQRLPTLCKKSLLRSAAGPYIWVNNRPFGQPRSTTASPRITDILAKNVCLPLQSGS